MPASAEFDEEEDIELPPVEALRRDLMEAGRVSLADYMARCNNVYYATRDPIGAEGDFITAPEISQMFGELIGLWLADLWMRAGKPYVHYVELGPGRGTLARDAVRAMAMVGLKPPVHFVETSPVLRAKQAEHFPKARWHNDLGSLPVDAPLLVVANEFFDALPVHQVVRTTTGWNQKDVEITPEGIRAVLGGEVPASILPDHLVDASRGEVIEASPASVRIMASLAMRLAGQSGVALIIDYGHIQTQFGDTFQAVRNHAFADPFVDPGEQDLTAHVDFGTLAAAASVNGLNVSGPVEQGNFLARLGLVERAMALSEVKPERAEQIASERDRLAGLDQMGRLFKVMAVSHNAWPAGAGF